MNQIIFRCLFFMTVAGLSLNAPLGADDKITVGRIRIDIDGVRYQDKAETVMTFTALRPGSRWSETALNREIRRTSKRLTDSGYFYDIRVIGIPSADNPLVWNINITVTGGFHLRFGGGSAWAMFGVVALGGRREDIRLWGGYNRAGLSWRGIAPVHLYWETSALYTNEGSFGHPPEWHRIDLTAEAGWQPHPDFRAGLFLNPVWYKPTENPDNDTRLDLRAGPRISFRADFFPDPFRLETEIRSEGSAIFSLTDSTERYLQGEASGFFRFGWKRLSLCGLLAGGGTDPETPALHRVDLYDTEDRQVRSGWSRNELSAGNWLMASGEFRLTLFEKFLPPFFALESEVFLFTDHAFVPEWRDAWGGGLRIKLDNPVFVYFTFAMGWNREGEGRFILTTTAGF